MNIPPHARAGHTFFSSTLCFFVGLASPMICSSRFMKSVKSR